MILSLDWVDLAGTLRAVWGNATVPARIVHCSLDSYSHGGSGMEYMGLPPVDLPMPCDADTLVSLILPRLQARRGATASGGTGRAKAAAEADGGAVTPAQGRNGALWTEDIARALRAATLGKEICLVRLPFGWNCSHFPLEGPLDYLGYDGGAGLGSGPGMAVGGSLGLLGSGRMPIAVLGDGDFLMGVTALWTASHYELPLLIVIANNHCYNNDVAHQERVALRRERPVDNKFIGQSIDGPPVDLTAMACAQGFGGGIPVTRLEELTPALEKAVAEVEKGGRCLVDVHIMAE